VNFNYDNRHFRLVQNSEDGESSEETTFGYHQQDDIVWGTYHGGEVMFGTLLARVEANGCLKMRYQHLNRKGEFRTGECYSIPEELRDGRYRIKEFWKWTSGEPSEGTSIIEEVNS